MLTYLSVKNLSVIEKVSLDFGKGLNIITGETGAGKSVLVGALKFLMGERFNKNTLRDINSPLYVEALFQSNLSHLPDTLKESYDINEELNISRTADNDGKNKVLINSKIATLNQLKEVSEYLMDIHGQHEHQLLFNSAKHLELIDFFIPDSIKSAYIKSFSAYKSKLTEIENLKKEIADSQRLKDIYSFDINEITALSLDEDKDSKLDDTIEFLSHIEKVRSVAGLAIDLLKTGEVNACDMIDKSLKSLSTVTNISSDLAKSHDDLDNLSSNILEIVANIEKVFDEDVASPDELNRLIDRKFKLNILYKKYGKDIKTILQKHAELKIKLDNINSSDDHLNKLNNELIKLEKNARKDADIINSTREDIAIDLSKKVVEILQQLELPSARFEVRFKYLEHLDKNAGVFAEFYISTNKGFDLSPLVSIASGGEVSRVMLALKEVFAESDNVETLLFDEIDTGISGKAGLAVAKRLKSLSKKKQLIVITHLPVVASASDHHFHISKSQKNEITATEIEKLDDNKKEHIIAVMISGDITDTSLSQAKEMINGELN